MNHRSIWKKHFGEIPRDSDGRVFEIHHKDGNHQNNSIENLICVPIEEHYRIHLDQGDYGAASLIAKRMGLPPNYLSEIQKGKIVSEEIKQKISAAKMGNIPWNKGNPGYRLNCDRKNKRFSSKLTIDDVNLIRKEFNEQIQIPDLEKIGRNGRNGIQITYKILFINYYAKKYNITEVAIKKILDGQTWKDGVKDARKHKTKS